MLENTKILYTMPGSVAGGGHLGTLEIMEGLQPYGFVPVAVVNEQATDITTLLCKKEIPYYYIPGYPSLMWKNTAKFLTQILRFWSLIKKQKIALVHHSDMITGHYGTLAAWLACIPSILHLKSLYWTKEYGWPNQFVLSRASLIIAISDAVNKAAFDTGLPKNKIITIHDGVDPSVFYLQDETRTSVRSEIGIREGVPVVGFVSRLGVEWKNESLVYKVVGELSRDFPGLTLLVVGGAFDGSGKTFANSKRRAAESGCGADIHFVGNQRNVPKFLSAMDVLLVPSREEPFGRVVIEGMAAGLPVIGSNNGGIPEMITDGHNGFLKSPDEVAVWTSAVKTLFKNPDRSKQIGKNARTTVDRRFTLNAMIERVAEEYFRLLKIKRTLQSAN